MEFLIKSFEILLILLKGSIIIAGFILVVFLFYSWIANIVTIIRFKRERRDNNDNYSVKRCLDEGDIKEGRDHFYLVSKTKFHHINPYTLGKLGYPRPPRVKEDDGENKRFYFKNGEYKIGREIKIRNIMSIINTIKDLKN